MLTKKTTPPTSFEARLNAAHAQADAAVSVIETIAVDLDNAAAEKSSIIIDIDKEISELYATIDNLVELRQEAVESETNCLSKATNIRSLLSA